MKLEKEKANLGENIANADEKEAELVELTERTFKFACYGRARFNDGSPDERRAIFLSLGSNFSLTGKNLSIDLHFPWKIIAERKESGEREAKLARTSKFVMNTSQIFSFANSFLSLRELEESDLRPRFWRPLLYHLTKLPLNN